MWYGFVTALHQGGGRRTASGEGSPHVHAGGQDWDRGRALRLPCVHMCNVWVWAVVDAGT